MGSPTVRPHVREASFQLEFGPDRLLEIVEVPFDVPERAEMVWVRYRVTSKGPGRCTVDLGLADPNGVRGWSGSDRQEVFIRADAATPGYHPGPLAAGRWAVLLGLYELPVEGCRVDVHVEVVLRHRRWLPGDLHVHTHHSDGRWSVPELADEALRAGLSWLVLADHNTSTQNREPAPGRPLLLIPGMEWTSYRGHACLVGVEEPLDDFRCRSKEDVARLLVQARSRGAYVDLAHPMERMCGSCAWEWGLDIPFDWVEVWNGPWRMCNAEALAWWQMELARGRRLVAVGGSDAHRPGDVVRVGHPVNWVLAEGLDRKSILEAIQAGRVSISRAPDAPALFLRCGDVLQGERVTVQQLRECGIQVGNAALQSRANGPLELRLVTAAGVVWTSMLESSATSTEPCLIHLSPENELGVILDDAGAHRYIRAELWEPASHCSQAAQEQPVSLTNPLWLT